MYNPQNAIERKLIEAYIASMVYGKEFPIVTDGYIASIERCDDHTWDTQGRLKCYLDIRKVPTHLANLLSGDTFPIWLSVTIDPENVLEGVQITWELEENDWSGVAQSNTWAMPPVLSEPVERVK